MNSQLGNGQSAGFEVGYLSNVKLRIRLDPAAPTGTTLICDFGWAVLTMMPAWYALWRHEEWVPSATLKVLRLDQGQPPSPLMEGRFEVTTGNTQCSGTGVEVN